MKITIKRNLLSAAMSAAASIVPLRGVRANLRNCRMEADANGALRIAATDLEIGLMQTLQAESVEKPETVCLPCVTIAGILKECGEDLVTLETIGAKGTITAGKDRFEILGCPDEDFPDVAVMAEDEPALVMGAKDLDKMIQRTEYASAREQGRYAINGVYLALVGKSLEMVGTDGRRLAFAKEKITSGEALKDGVIVTAKTMQEVRGICEGTADGDTIRLTLKGRTFLAARNGVTLSSLTLEGIYPKYKDVIPKNADKEITLNREKLLGALRKAVLLTSEETKTVSLSFAMGVCLIEARSPDKGQARVEMECEYSGEEITMGFNPQYLTEGLKAISSDTVRMELKNSNSPGVVREGTDFLYILMPVNRKE
jgi:DNA polymerase-3 subunit beta